MSELLHPSWRLAIGAAARVDRRRDCPRGYGEIPHAQILRPEWILTRQGADAPGGKLNYLHDHKLLRGFALLAYPEHWDQSGVMSFIVGPDGKVYQKNSGAETRRLARDLEAFNPDETWTVVHDEGVVTAALE